MFAVVPVKDLGQAKQRLAGHLSAERRRGLYLAMLEDVLAALAATPGLSGIVVVTRDRDAMDLARHYAARILVEPENLGQSQAVGLAAKTLAGEGAKGLLAIPGDVPLATPGELARVLATHRGSPGFTIVPASDGRGSNCILCSPPDLIPFHFGNDSFLPHLAEARSAGVEPRIVELPGIGLDIDTPDDLARFMAIPSATRARAYMEGEGDPRPDTEAALALTDESDHRELMEEARRLTEQGHGNVITYSKKVFIPLTRLCRNRCITVPSPIPPGLLF